MTAYEIQNNHIKLIIDRMKELEISKYKLAIECDVSKAMLGKYLSGKSQLSHVKFISILLTLDLDIQIKTSK